MSEYKTTINSDLWFPIDEENLTTAPLLSALRQLQRSVWEFGRATRCVLEVKGYLNEKQYPELLRRNQNDQQALQNLKDRQLANRCRYESGRVAIELARWQVLEDIVSVKSEIKEVLDFIDSCKIEDGESLLRDACLVMCVAAGVAISESEEIYKSASDLRVTDLTSGRATKAIGEAFATFVLDESNESHFSRRNLLFIDGLAERYAKDTILSNWLCKLEESYNAALKVHFVESDIQRVVAFRGRLNEHHFADKVERAAENELEEVYQKQQSRRAAYHASMVALEVRVRNSEETVNSLAYACNNLRELLAEESRYPGTEYPNRLLNCKGGEIVAKAVMNNLLCAVSLIREFDDKTLSAVERTLAGDITDGEALKATHEAIEKLRAQL